MRKITLFTILIFISNILFAQNSIEELNRAIFLYLFQDNQNLYNFLPSDPEKSAKCKNNIENTYNLAISKGINWKGQVTTASGYSFSQDSSKVTIFYTISTGNGISFDSYKIVFSDCYFDSNNKWRLSEKIDLEKIN